MGIEREKGGRERDRGGYRERERWEEEGLESQLHRHSPSQTGCS